METINHILQTPYPSKTSHTSGGDYEIAFNRPSLVGRELEYLRMAIERGHLSGDGLFTKKCNEYLENEVGASKALLTTSCTHALEMAALLLNLQPGDEIIVPSFTFVTTVNAFVVHGAQPVFVDVRRDTLNIDESRLEELITPRTKAIVPIHYAGVGCEMDEILDIANRRELRVVEDNAHGLFGKYKGRNLGTFGSLATQSFHETKNFNCGEGGALLINDPALVSRAEVIREKGTDRSRFFRGQVDRYTWIDVGSSYLPSDLLAAYLWGQLEARELVQANRSRIWHSYFNQLKDWAYKHDVVLPMIPSHCEQPYHMFYLLLPSLAVRTRLIQHLKRRSILAVYHYLPLHISPMGKQFGGKQGDCPVTEDISDRLLRLPFFTSLTQQAQDRVVEAIHEFEEW
jgi:dTDP-4-amino-4,6-dideoxygalactose transaminase